MRQVNSTPQFIKDAFVLAGGGSSRMGTDKALLCFQNTPLVERALTLLRSVGLTPRIVGRRPDLERYAPVIYDLREQCGPLSGIESGLLATSGEAAMFLPVDVPLLPADFLRWLLQRSCLTKTPATVPRVLGQPQPLSAVYTRDLLPAISEALDEGDYKVMRVVQQGAALLGRAVDIFDVEKATIASSVWDGWPSIASHAFVNCNTPEDFKRAARLAGHLKIDDSTLGQD